MVSNLNVAYRGHLRWTVIRVVALKAAILTGVLSPSHALAEVGASYANGFADLLPVRAANLKTMADALRRVANLRAPRLSDPELVNAMRGMALAALRDAPSTAPRAGSTDKKSSVDVSSVLEGGTPAEIQRRAKSVLRAIGAPSDPVADLPLVDRAEDAASREKAAMAEIAATVAHAAGRERSVRDGLVGRAYASRTTARDVETRVLLQDRLAEPVRERDAARLATAANTLEAADEAMDGAVMVLRDDPSGGRIGEVGALVGTALERAIEGEAAMASIAPRPGASGD